MKVHTSFAIGFILMMTFSRAMAQEPMRILALHVDTLGGASTKDALLLTNELARAITRVGGYDVITKSSAEIGRVFEEMGKTLPTVLDESSMRDLGSRWKANFVVSGTLGKSGDRRFAISLEMVSVVRGKTVSTVQLSVADFNHKLLLDRFARLLLWGRLRIVCNQSPYEAALDTKLLIREMMDPDYNVWLVEPNRKHVLQVRASKVNYTTYKEDLLLGIAELRTVEATLKYQMGVLVVKSIPEAKVYLGDEMAGTTALRKEVQAGEYILTLKAGRHDDVLKKVTIVPEETTFVSQTLPVNYGSYRRNGIISAAVAALFVGGGLYASSEADRTYNQYLETMNTNVMSDRRDKAKTLDIASYASYGIAGAFAVWSVLEWVGLMTSHEPSVTSTELKDGHRLKLSLSNKGLTLTFQLY